MPYSTEQLQLLWGWSSRPLLRTLQCSSLVEIVIGFGVGASSIAAPVYLAETLPVKWRVWGIGIYFDFW
jgi:hypothetical protein